MELVNYIRKDTVFFIDKTDKAGVLDELIEKSIALGAVRDASEFRLAVRERESLMSTGIGLGVAIPHAKLGCIDDFFIVTAVCRHPVEWDALDRKPVSIVFLIGGPEDSQGDYLRLLSRLMLMVKNEAKLGSLKAATKAEEVAEIAASDEEKPGFS